MNAFEIKPSIRESLGTVGVFYGGTSAERPVSLESGAAVIAALEAMQIRYVAIDTGVVSMQEIHAMKIDRAFIALHGVGGEDGTIQGALKSLRIPFTGCDVMASAIGMDKWRTKLIWKGMGLPTAEASLLKPYCNWQAVINELGGVAMVKPVREGSSIGMARVTSAEGLKKAYQEAVRFDALVIAERWIQGREFTVALLGSRVLPAIELVTDHEFYDYQAKYHSDTTRYLCPAPLSRQETLEIESLALSAFNSIGGKGWGRVDFMRDREGNFYLLEVNTVPGLTSHSLVPMAAKQAGIGFNELIYRILEQTLGGEA